MTTTSRHRYLAINLLILLFLTPSISLGQSPSRPDLILTLPTSDTVITIDVKRVMSEVLPRLLADEPALRPLVLSLLDVKPLIGFDPQAVEAIALGLRYTNLQNDTSESDFNFVAVARSSEAARLPAILRQISSVKFVEQQYGGKTLFVLKPAESQSSTEASDKPTEGQSEFAITTLDESTMVFGDIAEVRAAVDVSAGKSKGISPEQSAALKRSPNALLSATSLIPSSMRGTAQQIGNAQLTEALSSLKTLNGSVALSPSGLEVVVKTSTASPEQAKHLAEVLGAFRTLTNSLAPGKAPHDKIVREVIRRMLFSTEGNELEVRTVFTQGALDALAKLMANDTYMSRGVAQIGLKDPEGAIVHFDKAILLLPDSALGYYNRGKANADKANLDAAIVDYDKAITLAPEWEVPYNNRGFVRLTKGEFDAAIIDFDKAIALDPTSAYPYNNRGDALFAKGELEKAMADFDKSIALDPSNPFAFTNRGYARIEKGELDGALADLERAITLAPKMAKAYNGRGVVRYQRYEHTGSDQELKQAIEDFNQAITLDPNNAVFYSNRGYALTGKEELDRAIADFDKALALNPQLGGTYNGRGIARYYKGEFDRAIADYESAMALLPNSAELYGNRALARTALRLDEQAAQDLKKCYELDPSTREIYEPAIKEIKKTRRGKPKRPH